MSQQSHVALVDAPRPVLGSARSTGAQPWLASCRDVVDLQMTHKVRCSALCLSFGGRRRRGPREPRPSTSASCGAQYRSRRIYQRNMRHLRHHLRKGGALTPPPLEVTFSLEDRSLETQRSTCISLIREMTRYHLLRYPALEIRAKRWKMGIPERKEMHNTNIRIPTKRICSTGLVQSHQSLSLIHI